MNGNNQNKAYADKKYKRISLAAAKKERAKKKIQNIFFASCLVIVLLILSGWLLFDKLFIIKDFSVVGTKEYTSEQSVEFAQRIGLKKGMNVFGFYKKEAEKKAKYYLSEFDSVNIGYDLPHGIVFKVKEAVPAMYISENGNNYILSESLRVISVTQDASVPESLYLKKVYISGIVKCQTGEFLETDNDSDKVLKELYAVLKENKAITDVAEIDVRNKFALSFLYKGRFTVKLGSAENLTVKVRFLQSIVNQLKDTDSGYLDISDEDLREGILKSYK